ncbi:MAG: transcription-repair coupling factor, partial [Flavobacteriia bacterium]
MSKQTVLEIYGHSPKTKQIVKALKGERTEIQLTNLVGSSFSFVFASIFKDIDNPFLLICNDKEEAAYYLNDLEQFLGEKNLLFYPGSYRRPYQIEETDNANILLRAEVLNRINSQKKPAIIVTYPDALFEKVITKSELNRNSINLKTGEEISLDFINELLFEYHFKRVDFVTEPGDFAVRGGIIDVFSFSNEDPYRIEFFGDEIESIRTFDIETQLSIDKINRIKIMPNVENKLLEEKRENFLRYIVNKTIVFVKDKNILCAKLDKLFDKAERTFKDLSGEIVHTKPGELFCNGSEIVNQLQDYTLVNFGNPDHSKNNLKEIRFNIKPQPSFNKQFDLLIENLRENSKRGISNYLFCDNQKQAQRFHDIFEDIDGEVQYKTFVLPLYQGFIDEDPKIACYTDHQIFDRYHKFRLKSSFNKKQSISLKELTSLEIGDYVTHIDHGIGKFGGLQKIDVEGKTQEAIKLIYGDRDVLYISIHSLHKISKYNGKDGKAPKIYKLGSGAWKKLKQKTKKRVKEIAYDLIKLYAKRKMQKGISYSPDSYLQHELEASFMFEDTPDQLTATIDVKKDMESEQPMDRLVCGDVGFGKTEIAIRAAFKAIDNGKQVAILVPTTILAFQHFKTFSERLKDFPITIDYLNRFRSTKQRNEILKG